jgi:hypothetical protein
MHCFDAHPSHQDFYMLTADHDSLLMQLIAQHVGTLERVLQVQLTESLHKFQIAC